ncbi:MAG: TonB-dependent receptor [Rudaea sp.]|uniref:STN domain-containing protein n=1 Tax=Rudaea sp. TaxID=2136325 RepID=UPI0039E39A09
MSIHSRALKAVFGSILLALGAAQAAETPSQSARPTLPVSCDAAAATGNTAKVDFNIAQEPLSDALAEWSRQSGLQVLRRDGAANVQEITAPKVAGKFLPTEALDRMLAGSGFRYEFVNGCTVRISSASDKHAAAAHVGKSDEAQATPGATAGSQAQKTQDNPSTDAPESASQKKTAQLEDVVVTGTHIRGVQPSSPVLMISQDDMRLAGDNNLGDVIRSLPQNFNGGQNPGVMIGASVGGIANQNITGASSLNLRGLGPDATLTLLNGVRLPYDAFSQATDVAVIPVFAPLLPGEGQIDRHLLDVIDDAVVEKWAGLTHESDLRHEFLR